MYITYIFTYIHICIYMYIYIHTHTHMYRERKFILRNWSQDYDGYRYKSMREAENLEFR